MDYQGNPELAEILFGSEKYREARAEYGMCVEKEKKKKKPSKDRIAYYEMKIEQCNELIKEKERIAAQ